MYTVWFNHSFGWSACKLLCIFFECFLRFWALVKCLSHFSQACGRRCWWTIIICVFNWLARVNALSHWSHANGFSPVCVTICRTTSVDVVKYLPHSLHACDRIRWCTNFLWKRKADAWENVLPHCWHAKGRSPVK